MKIMLCFIWEDGSRSARRRGDKGLSRRSVGSNLTVSFPLVWLANENNQPVWVRAMAVAVAQSCVVRCMGSGVRVYVCKDDALRCGVGGIASCRIGGG